MRKTIKLDIDPKLIKFLEADILADLKQVVRINHNEMLEKAQKNATRGASFDAGGKSTGNLRRKMAYASKLEDDGLTGVVRSIVPYAQYVELGTRKMKARPYLRPAFDQQKTIFLKDLKKWTSKNLRG